MLEQEEIYQFIAESKESFDIAYTAYLNSGFKLHSTQVKRKYWLFGKKIYILKVVVDEDGFVWGENIINYDMLIQEAIEREDYLEAKRLTELRDNV